MKISMINTHTAIYDALSNDSVVLDLGASQGAFSKQLKRKVNCVIHQVEANPELYNKLIILDKTISYNLAISNSNSKVAFYISDHPSSSSLRSDKKTNYTSKINIQCRSLQTFVKENKIQNIDLLKIDVEGAEIDILLAVDEILMDRISQISVEFHEKQFDTIKEIPKINAVINQLKSYGMFVINFTKPHYSDVLIVNLNHIPINIFKRFILILYFEYILASYRILIIHYNRSKKRIVNRFKYIFHIENK